MESEEREEGEKQGGKKEDRRKEKARRGKVGLQNHSEFKIDHFISTL